MRVGRAVVRAENVALAGSQVKRGTTLLSVGQVLGSREIALLAAIGMGKVPGLSAAPDRCDHDRLPSCTTPVGCA